MNTNGETKNGDESKVDNSMNEDGSSSGLHAPKLNHLVLTCKIGNPEERGKHKEMVKSFEKKERSKGIGERGPILVAGAHASKPNP
ncbi:hypothetical protein V6N13_072618 [Hibiscus sabdariffa]|uniref:Uncharacterized protein n=2 Tax=Hibiscus sabdariffa TaxID=183260 RepID=A0ABR2A5N0_9ROSI